MCLENIKWKSFLPYIIRRCTVFTFPGGTYILKMYMFKRCIIEAGSPAIFTWIVIASGVSFQKQNINAFFPLKKTLFMNHHIFFLHLKKYLLYFSFFFSAVSKNLSFVNWSGSLMPFESGHIMHYIYPPVEYFIYYNPI